MDSATNEDQDPQLEESSTSEEDTSNTEKSSDSKSPEDETSTYDVVMNAIKPEDDDKGESESNSDEDGKSKDDAEGDNKNDPDDQSEELSDNDFEDLSPEARKHLKKETGERFDKLKDLYRGSKEQVTDLTSRLEQSEVGAGHYKQFNDFLETNRISSDEANNLFNIGACMKNDPAKALELIAPYYNTLLQVTGNVLSPDLKQQVDQGYMTQAHALELSRHRATGHNNQTIQQDQQQHQQRKEVTRQEGQVNSMNGAIANWEQQWSKSDMDYSLKKDRVLDRVELKLARAQRDGTLPQTVEQAVELANKAKTEVEAEISQSRPKKVIDTVNGGKSSTSAPAPQTTLDVVRNALN